MELPLSLLYPVWAVSTGLSLSAAWIGYLSLVQRNRLLSNFEAILQSVSESAEFPEQARRLCQVCCDQFDTVGCSLYLCPEATAGFQRIVEVGRSSDEVGQGLVRDLIAQALEARRACESNYAGHWLLSLPLLLPGGAAGVLLLVWDSQRGETSRERRLLQVSRAMASLILPRPQDQGALARAQQELKSLQAEMAEESHLASVGRLAAGVAHELNTPLGAVLTMVSSLQKNETDPNRNKRLRIMREAVEKCRDIIQKLLIYSRDPVETEQGLTFSRFVRTDSDLNSVIRDTAELLTDTLAQDNVKIELDLRDLPPTRINSNQFGQVFSNLLINARDALKAANVKDPEIQIRTRVEFDKICIEVADNGIGISEEIRKKIFQPFFTTKEIGRGTGLGLAICSEIVRKHHGNISVGTGPKGGALFLIQVPITVSGSTA
jgi:signal transduction histidine kinase